MQHVWEFFCGENIDLDILTDVHTFSPYWLRKIVFRMPSVCVYVSSVCTYISIVTWWSDCRMVLDWRSDLLDSLIQLVTTLYNSLLHTHTHTHTLVSPVTSSLAVALLRLPKADVPLALSSRTITGLSYSFSQQQLTTTEPQQFSDWLTDWLTQSPTKQLSSSQLIELTLTTCNCPACNISARTVQKTLFLCCCLQAVV
jgi:hypothetical protein